ncbi:MAG: hypothetical protein KDB66_12000 [Solirubrobacterales bacterium]|nr:hypothetical protein [Solirubrobacterales bacterium]
MALKWTRAATRHRISRDRSQYVIEHSGIRFEQYPPAGSSDVADLRYIYLGDDPFGTPLEVIAVELNEGDLLVIHAMKLRKRYEEQYERARKWRR